MREDLRPGLATIEWELMEAAWTHGEGPVSRREFTLNSGREWAAGSLEALLSRLVEKGYLIELRSRLGICRYRAAVSRPEALRSGLLSWFAARKLDEDSLSEAAQLLQTVVDERRGARGSRRPA